NHFRELGIGDVKNAVAPCDGHGAGEFGSTYAFVTPPRSVGKIGVANQIRLGVGDAEVGGFVEGHGKRLAEIQAFTGVAGQPVGDAAEGRRLLADVARAVQIARKGDARFVGGRR